MSYAICKVVVGSPVPEKLRDLVNEIDLDLKEVGFKMLYNGGGSNEPGYCGVVLCEFDECEERRVSSLRLVPTPEQIEKAKQLLVAARVKLTNYFAEDDDEDDEDNGFSDEERLSYINSIPVEPDVYLIWSSS